jgi:disulfide bond formation protein DsbB
MTRSLLVVTASTSIALIGAALYLQHVEELLPCPLCVIQRYAYLGIAVFALLAAFTQKQRKLFTGLALASALAGLAVVAKHLWILAHPGLSCGIDPMETTLNKIPTAEYLPWIFKASGLCEDALDKVLGLSIPQWSGIWFVILTAALVTAFVQQRRA